ncbi:Uncharacterised protein [Vibrio cholerae]|nr:Uncharacterised protein [Vibrio cholerae]
MPRASADDQVGTGNGIGKTLFRLSADALYPEQ